MNQPLIGGLIMSQRKETGLHPWWRSTVYDTSKGPLCLGLSCIKWSKRQLPLTRRTEIIFGKMPYKREWKMWRLHSKSYQIVRRYPTVTSMSIKMEFLYEGMPSGGRPCDLYTQCYHILQCCCLRNVTYCLNYGSITWHRGQSRALLNAFMMAPKWEKNGVN